VLVERSDCARTSGSCSDRGSASSPEAVQDPTEIDYANLPGFPKPTVEGHGSRAVMGRIGEVPVAVLHGRAHLYEGIGPEFVQTPVRALRAAGAELLVLTNAAGSLRGEVGPGRLMLITDHINMSGVNVLSGPNETELGERFTSLHDAYDPELAGALLFGFSSAVAQRLPTFSESLAVLFQALPYVLTLVVVAGVIGRSRPPAAIGVPYVKE
jgi:inosine/guanosine/xanthosine phosphorylase family protein